MFPQVEPAGKLELVLPSGPALGKDGGQGLHFPGFFHYHLYSLKKKKRTGGGQCFISIAVKNPHCLALLLPWQNLGACPAGLHELLAVWLRGSAKTLRSHQLDSSPSSAAP